MKTIALCAWIMLLVATPWSPVAAQTFVNSGTPNFIQSITFYETEPPTFLPIDYIDITFANGEERLGVPVETGIQLLDEPIPIALPDCGCLDLDNVPIIDLNKSVAYYYSRPDPQAPQLGSILDGLLIREHDGVLCINAIRKDTFPIPLITVFGDPDCLVLQLSAFPISRIRRLQFLLEYAEVHKLPDRVRPPKGPGPICLSCPPWEKYLDDTAQWDGIHAKNRVKELERVAKLVTSTLRKK